MPLPSTLTPIATIALTSSTSSITFSNLPQTYTDLVLVVNCGASVGAGDNLYARMNGDTGTNYSMTEVNGYGSAARSARTSNTTVTHLSYYVGFGSGVTNVFVSNFMNYANTNTNKTILTRCGHASTGTEALVSLWRSTSAITSIQIYPSSSGTLSSDSTFTLYGVKAA